MGDGFLGRVPRPSPTGVGSYQVHVGAFGPDMAHVILDGFSGSRPRMARALLGNAQLPAAGLSWYRERQAQQAFVA